MRNSIEKPCLISHISGGPCCPEGVPYHKEKGKGLKRTEYAANPKPVARGPYPVVVMACAEYAGKHDKTDLNIHPFFDNFPARADCLHQHERKERSCNDLP